MSPGLISGEGGGMVALRSKKFFSKYIFLYQGTVEIHASLGLMVGLEA